MDTEEVMRLIDRFLDAQTTLEEEERLYEYFRKPGYHPSTEPYRQMFLDLGTISAPCKKHRKRSRILRMAAAVAASVALVAGIAVGMETYKEHQLALRYDGSYMIIDGKRIDNLTALRLHIEHTLGEASLIEQYVSRQNMAMQAEQEIIDNINDPEERERIKQLLKQ